MNTIIIENATLKQQIHILEDKVRSLKTDKEKEMKSVEEHKSRVETLESRLENLTSKYQELQQQYQDAELELTAFRGSKKDKDERLSDFKREILTLQEMYKAEVKSHNSTTVELHKHQDMLKALREDHDDLHEKFLIANRSRNDIEVDLKDETQICNELKRDIKERDKIINNLRVQLEQQEFQITTLERDLDNKDIKISAIEKQHTAKLEQLNDRVVQIQQLLNTEKQNKDFWIAKFEKEQQQNGENRNDLLQVQSVIKDRELKIKDVNIKLESLQKTYDYLQQVNAETQDKCNSLFTKCENLERILNTKTLMLEKTENEKQSMINENKSNVAELREEFQHTLEITSMTLEDYLQTGIILHNRVRSRDVTIFQKASEIIDKNTRISQLSSLVTSLTLSRDQYRESLELTQCLLDEEISLHSYYREELAKIQVTCKSLMTAMDLKNKANENLTLEKNRTKAHLNQANAILKKTEQEYKSAKGKISEMKEVIDQLTEDKKLIIKERDHHFKRLKDATKLIEILQAAKFKDEHAKSVANLSDEESKSRQAKEIQGKRGSEQRLLEVKVDYQHPKSAMDKASSSKSIKTIKSDRRITELPVYYFDTETQTLTMEELLNQERENRGYISSETQTDQAANPSKTVQTLFIKKASAGIQTSEELIVPILETLSLSKYLETGTTGNAQTQRSELHPGLGTTPRNLISTQEKESDSKSLKFEDSMHASEYQFPGSKFSIDKVLHPNQFKIAVDSIQEIDHSKTQSTNRSDKRPLVIIKKATAAGHRGTTDQRYASHRKSRTNYFDRRAESYAVTERKGLISPIKEEIRKLNIGHFKPYRQYRIPYNANIEIDDRQGKPNEFEATSSHFQNILTSKYDATLDKFNDPRKAHAYRKLLKTSERRVLNYSQQEGGEEQLLLFKDPNMNHTFNSVSNKFVVKPISPQMKITGKCAIKQLIKGASSRD